MDVAGLIRFSAEEQRSGYSTEAQLRGIENFCTERGWTLVGKYIDDAYTGRNLNRPALKKLIADGRKHKFQAVIVHKFDRLSRNRADAITVKALFRKELGIKIYSASEVSEDDDEVSGSLNEGMLEVVAEWYSRNLSAETKKGKKERAFDGKYNGVLSFGYQPVPKEQGGIPVFHPTNIEGYRMSIRMVAEGRTVREVMNALNAAGYVTTGNRGANPFSMDTVLPMLKNRFYLGEVYYKGTWLPGKHEPAIDRETWERAQEQLRRRATRHETTKLTDRVYALRKKLYCVGCGRRLRGRNQHGRRCYRCPADAYGEVCPECRDLGADPLEAQVGQWLAHWTLPAHWQSQVVKRLGTGDEQAREMRKRIATLNNALEKIANQHEWGFKTDEAFLSESANLKREIASIQMPPAPNLVRARQWLQNLPGIWKCATDLERLKLSDALIEKAWIEGGGIVAIEPRPALYPLVADINPGPDLVILAPKTDYRAQYGSSVKPPTT